MVGNKSQFPKANELRGRIDEELMGLQGVAIKIIWDYYAEDKADLHILERRRGLIEGLMRK